MKSIQGVFDGLEIPEHLRQRGALKELDWVCKVIEDGASAEIRLRGEDKTYECLTDILDNAGIAPEERAKMLTGCSEV